MRKKALILVMSLITLFAQVSAVSACNIFGYQPPTPKSLQK